MTSSYLVRRLARQRTLRAPRGVASGCTHGVGSQVMRAARLRVAARLVVGAPWRRLARPRNQLATSGMYILLGQSMVLAEAEQFPRLALRA